MKREDPPLPNQPPDGSLPRKEVAARERQVLAHFLTTPYTPHKPLKGARKAKANGKSRKKG
jgi:hypothetical protein